MPDHPTPDLDTRIRALVARAVADAPPAPELEPMLEPRRDHRRWWIGGGIALAAAAAAVAIFTFGGQDDKVSTVPATDPPTTVATVPERPPVTVPATVEPTVPPTNPELPPTTSPSAPVAGAIVTAGPDGVTRWTDGEPRSITTEPMAFAIDAGDGRIIAQRAQGYTRYRPDRAGSGARATAPVVIGPDGSIDALWPGAGPAYVTIHDVAVVEGETLVLYTSAEHPPQSLDDMSGEIAYVASLDDRAATPVEIGQVSGWEYGVDRLHLATTGLIVGQWNSGPSHGIDLRAVPGSPAERDGLPTAESLGLPADGFGDCSNCPWSFSVTPDGAAVAWVDPVDDFSGYELTFRPLAGDQERRTTLSSDVPVNLLNDVDLSDEEVLLSFFDGGFGIPGPVTVPVADPTAAPTNLAGEVATVGASAH